MLGVLSIHSLGWMLPSIQGVGASLLSNGARGVQLLFVVAAYSALLSWDRKASTGGPQTASQYWLRRFVRLAPLYYLALAIALAVYGTGPNYWTGGHVPITLANIVSHVLFVSVVNPYWINSILMVEWLLGVLVCFIAVVPLLARWIRTPLQAAVLAVICTAVAWAASRYLPAASPIPEIELWRNYLGIWPLAQAPAFAMGVLAYRVQQHYGPFLRRRGVRSFMLVVGLILAAGLASEVIQPKFPVATYGIAFSLILLATLGMHGTGPVTSTLGRFGRISYAVYLCHFMLIPPSIALLGLMGLGSVAPVVWLTVLLLSTVVGWLLTKYVANPVAALLERRLVSRVGAG